MNDKLRVGGENAPGGVTSVPVAAPFMSNPGLVSRAPGTYSIRAYTYSEKTFAARERHCGVGMFRYSLVVGERRIS